MKNETGINIFELMNKWFLFASENKLNGNHTALFFFCVELNNRLAWKTVFGLPTYESAEYIGVSPNTFRKCLNDLAKVGIVKIVKKSTNHFVANQVSMKEAYQNLLKLSNGNYQSFVKAQQQQLQKLCTIDRQEDKETIKQIDSLKAENEKLKIELSKLKKSKTSNIDKAREFYNAEIEKANGDENYNILVRFLFGEYATDTTTRQIHENVLQMKNQLSFEDFNKLMALKPKEQKILTSIQTLNDGKDSKGSKYSRHAGIFTTIKSWYDNDKRQKAVI